MKVFTKAKKFSAIFLSICILLGVFSMWVGIYTPEVAVVEEAYAASYDSYYANLNVNQQGTSFRTSLASLITTTHSYNPTYGGLSTIFDDSDADPNKSGNILWFYTGTSVSFSGSFSGTTNREHVWPKNNGNAFPAESEAGSDAHHLRPTNAGLNSTRSNNNFGEVETIAKNIVKENGSSAYDNLCYQANSVFYPGVGYRGATARILMYVQTRWGNQYNLKFVLGKGSNKTIGDIEDLMKWHLQEPPTAEEKARNEAVYKVQGNRNPFIDHPEYAEMIYCYDGQDYNDELQDVVETYGGYLDGSEGSGGNTTVAPTGVALSASPQALVAGETHKFTATVYPAGASQEVTWTSSNPLVATVNDGTVAAVAAGTTTITATSTKDETIKATATITVKAVSSITITGTPVKTSYTAGDVFNPTGLTITATYTDSSTSNVSTASCEWLDGTTNVKSLSQGTTTVTCKYGSATAIVTGITVKEATLKTLSISRAQFSSGNKYDWTDWTADSISGKGYMYPGNPDAIQMNSGKTNEHIFNTTALSGGVVSITIKASAGKNWDIYTSSTPFTTDRASYGNATKKGTISSTSAGTKLELNVTDQYFAIIYASTGVAYIDEIIITYGSSSSVHVHTPSDWIIDKQATCTSVGGKHKECTSCHEIIDAEEIPLAEHSYGSWTQTLAPTCSAVGKETATCVNCSDTQTRDVATIGHSLSDWAPAGNNTEERHCTNCSYSETRTVANQQAVEAFVALVDDIKDATDLNSKWTAISQAVNAYNKLTASEREAASTAYATLQSAISAYNSAVKQINDEATLANENALAFFGGAISILAVAAYFFFKA
ncbi:MAG: endonuclease [Clostridia bacterium]|nr:endonuclease [Clostridia bacterium]